MNKAVYIGAGLDIIPVLVLNKINTFIYIDSQPISEFGMFYWNDKKMYRKHFLPKLEKLMKNNNFTKTIQKNNYIEYTNKIQTIKYFINTPFPEKITDEIEKEIRECNTLIIAGYNPNNKIIEIMPNLKNIIGNCHTCYNHNDYEDENEKNNSTFNYLINKNNPNICYNYLLLKEIKEIEYWNLDLIKPELSDNYKIISCKDLIDFEKAKLSKSA